MSYKLCVEEIFVQIKNGRKKLLQGQYYPLKTNGMNASMFGNLGNDEAC